MNYFVQIHPQFECRFAVSFESMAEAMKDWPGMYFEMDGSFVWMDRDSREPRQMDGMVYDRSGQIEYVELKGHFSLHQWGLLCSLIVGLPWPTNRNHAPMDSSSELAKELVWISQNLDPQMRVHDVARGEWMPPSHLAKSLLSSHG